MEEYPPELNWYLAHKGRDINPPGTRVTKRLILVFAIVMLVALTIVIAALVMPHVMLAPYQHQLYPPTVPTMIQYVH